VISASPEASEKLLSVKNTQRFSSRMYKIQAMRKEWKQANCKQMEIETRMGIILACKSCGITLSCTKQK